MKEVIEFNLNDKVLVKVTPLGKKVLERDHYNFWAWKIGDVPEFIHKEEIDGWSEWQLWELMQALGKYMGAGMENVIEVKLCLIKD